MNTIIATTPQAMQEAQQTTTRWVERKIDGARAELVEVEATRAALIRAGAETKRVARLAKLAERRIRFYEKIKAALDAGYVIIPPFAVQAFAIRVPENSVPSAERSRNSWTGDESTRRLAIGEGRYVHPRPARERIDTETEKLPHDPTKTREVAIYENKADWLRVDIPVIAQKPQIIDAVKGAMDKLLFDALGIAPAYRDADPIIVGQITHWRDRGNPVTFFVAWWMDERDL